jgi:glucose/arabinose dehydrogenase
MTNLMRSRWIAASGAALVLCACGGGGSSNGGGGTPTPIPLPPNGPTVGVEQVFSGVTLSNPVAMLQAPGDNMRWFVVEQAGHVRVFDNDPMVITATDFIDISASVTFDGEAGLLGMAFHPDFPTDPRVYLFYSHTDSVAGLESRLSEFTTSNGGQTLNAASERIILTIEKPNNESNHNGGNLAFGPDGFLYLGIGDGGGGNDQHGSIGNAQNLLTLLGKMLRIDVDNTQGMYAIPPGNPFAGNVPCGANGSGTANCPEIFAVGFRNPWRWSFDRQTGELWVGDVGQSTREEVDRVVLNGNYGWRCEEGTVDTGMCGSAGNFLPPVVDYGRSVGTTVTGGYVYRGNQFASLMGRYIFADFGSHKIWNIANGTQPTVQPNAGFDSGLSISSFGQGNDGELYAVSYDGRLFHITD